MRERRQSLIAALLALLAFGSIAGCSGGVATSSELLDATYSPRAPLRAAVEDLMRAEKDGVYKTSFALLTPESREKFKDVAAWQQHRASMPAIKSFELQASTEDSQTVLVERDTKQIEVWAGKKYRNGWLVEAEPEVSPA